MIESDQKWKKIKILFLVRHLKNIKITIILKGFSDKELTFFVVIQYLIEECPNGWIYMQGSCYKFSSKALNWNAAKSACEALGSNLVVINSQAEQQALTTKIPGSQRTWIGLHRNPKDKSRLVWVDGSPVTYTHWYKGEPSSLREECGEMYRKVHGWKWNDMSCSATFPYVCETRRKLCLTSNKKLEYIIPLHYAFLSFCHLFSNFQPTPVGSFLWRVALVFLLPAVSHPIKGMDLLVLLHAPVDIKSAVLRLLSAEEVELGVDNWTQSPVKVWLIRCVFYKHLYDICHYSQLSPCGHLAITDTPLLQALPVPANKNYWKYLSLLRTSYNLYYYYRTSDYGHQIVVPKVSVIEGVDFNH